MRALKRSTSASAVLAPLAALTTVASSSSDNGNGSYSTGTLKPTAGSGRYLTDGCVQLDWSSDGKRDRSPVLFTASAVV
ncbi:hypothetical protein KMT30_08915 [Streptomyces sp. IBSBF 2953]|nr:hypothetical protein [Streptomyces hayashii]